MNRVVLSDMVKNRLNGFIDRHKNTHKSFSENLHRLSDAIMWNGEVLVVDEQVARLSSEVFSLSKNDGYVLLNAFKEIYERAQRDVLDLHGLHRGTGILQAVDNTKFEAKAKFCSRLEGEYQALLEIEQREANTTPEVEKVFKYIHSLLDELSHDQADFSTKAKTKKDSEAYYHAAGVLKSLQNEIVKQAEEYSITLD